MVGGLPQPPPILKENVANMAPSWLPHSIKNRLKIDAKIDQKFDASCDRFLKQFSNTFQERFRAISRAKLGANIGQKPWRVVQKSTFRRLASEALLGAFWGRFGGQDGAEIEPKTASKTLLTSTSS